ncbi:SCO family protein [uncultured Croceitalea sp.]|uniref:SCO family protein n=1 Tax=uncultured Croceitalea sp. TaxID=1798908 RepID=UPI00374F0E8D
MSANFFKLFVFVFLLSNTIDVFSQDNSKIYDVNDLSIYQLTSKWKTQENKTITFQDLEKNTLVMVMMFTSCKLSCPRLVSDIRAIEEEVSETVKKNIKYILISIDPETDTPKVLKDFAIQNDLVGNQWLLLHGQEKDIREFANVVAVSYKEISPINFSHSNIISVFDKKGELKYQQEGFGNKNTEIVKQIIRL